MASLPLTTKFPTFSQQHVSKSLWSRADFQRMADCMAIVRKRVNNEDVFQSIMAEVIEKLREFNPQFSTAKFIEHVYGDALEDQQRAALRALLP